MSYADGEAQDYVDNNTSNVDSVADAGTMSNFSAEQYGPDSIFDTLQEALHSGAGEKSPDSSGGSGWVDTDNVLDENTATYAYNDVPGNTKIGLGAALMGYLSTPTYVNTIRYYITRSSTYVNEVKISVYNHAAAGYVTVYQGAGTWNSWTNLSLGSNYYTDEIYMTFNNSHPSTTYQARINELDFYNETHYCFDQEVQWTNANYTRTYEELCIYAGTTGTENLPVYVRSGGSWVLVLSDLTDSGWANVSVTSYLTSDTFTIRFGSGTYTGLDGTQDSWQIDAALLHTWNVNSAPAAGEFQAPATAYANQYAFINHTVQDVDGNTTFANSTLTVVNGSAVFLWVSSSNTFSESSDSSNYWTLDAANSLRVYVNATAFRLCFKLKAWWNFTEGQISVEVIVFDTDNANGTASSSDLFSFEDDLIVDSATISDNYMNPSSSLSVTAQLFYQGTSTSPEDVTGITGYIALGATVKGYSSSINSSGYFTCSFTSEASVGNSSYNVFALTDHGTVQNCTIWNLVDRLIITIVIGDNRVNVFTNATISVTAVYSFDSLVFDGTFLLNYTTYLHSTLSRHGYTVLSVSGGTRDPVTSIQTNDQDYVIWDYVIANLSVADNNVDVNVNASMSVSGTYGFDGAVFDGVFTLNYTTFNQSTPQRQGYTVSGVSGGAYGITVIGVNDVDYVVWNRALIESGGVSSNYLHVGDSGLVYFVVKYEYEGTEVIDGNVLVNGSAMTYNASLSRWEYSFSLSVQGNYSYVVTDVSGNSEGITVLNDLAGLQSCTFYANVYICAKDTEDNTILSDVTVYMYNGSSLISGSPGAGESLGGLTVGSSGTLFSQVVSGGWVNWTGITSAAMDLNATWHSICVNVTWTLTVNGDAILNMSCLCYPFTPVSTIYHAASNATISSCSYASYTLTVQFSGAAGTYVLCASGPSPTYVLNVTYDLASDYTTFLQLSHDGSRNIQVNYQNWGNTYVRKVDKIMSALSFADQRLTMTFSGTASDIGEVNVVCGSRGNPPETSGFTTISYLSGTFIGYYVFTNSSKTVWVQWTTSGESGTSGTTGRQTSFLIDASFNVTDKVVAGQSVPGVLRVTWTGEAVVYISLIQFEDPYSDWTVSMEGLPMMLRLDMNVTGDVLLPFTVIVPKNVTAKVYRVPCMVMFSTPTELTKTIRESLSFTVSQPSLPIPALFIFASLGGFAALLIGALFTSHSRKHPA